MQLAGRAKWQKCIAEGWGWGGTGSLQVLLARVILPASQCADQPGSSPNPHRLGLLWRLHSLAMIKSLATDDELNPQFLSPPLPGGQGMELKVPNL